MRNLLRFSRDLSSDRRGTLYEFRILIFLAVIALFIIPALRADSDWGGAVLKFFAGVAAIVTAMVLYYYLSVTIQKTIATMPWTVRQGSGVLLVVLISGGLVFALGTCFSLTLWLLAVLSIFVGFLAGCVWALNRYPPRG